MLQSAHRPHRISQACSCAAGDSSEEGPAQDPIARVFRQVGTLHAVPGEGPAELLAAARPSEVPPRAPKDLQLPASSSAKNQSPLPTHPRVESRQFLADNGSGEQKRLATRRLAARRKAEEEVLYSDSVAEGLGGECAAEDKVEPRCEGEKVESRLRSFLEDAKNGSAGGGRGLPEARVQEMLRLAARRNVEDPKEIYRLFVQETVQRAVLQEEEEETNKHARANRMRFPREEEAPPAVFADWPCGKRPPPKSATEGAQRLGQHPLFAFGDLFLFAEKLTGPLYHTGFVFLQRDGEGWVFFSGPKSTDHLLTRTLLIDGLLPTRPYAASCSSEQQMLS